MTNGLCDNLLTCIVRAWDLENIKKKPIIVCPAMNTCMYKHPLTKIQLDLLVNQFGFTLIEPIEKKLMCGDTGIGAMASIETIVKILFNLINSFYS
jgi:phosphopantothenoylcysteine decarboxylase